MDKPKKRRQKSGGGGVGDLPLGRAHTNLTKTSTSSLTASSSSEYPHSTSGNTGPPGTSSSGRPSDAWDSQTQQPSGSAITSQTAVDTAPEDHSDELPNEIWPKADSDDSTEDTTTSHRRPEKSAKTGGPRKRGFFRSLVQKFNKTTKRWGLVPNTKEEQDRNVIQHQVIAELFDGRLHLAPLKHPRRVLDVGAGQGMWALIYELAQRNRNSAVLGVDLERVRAPFKMPNCSFMEMDVTEEWNFETKFDFIHVRMLGDIQDKAKLLQSIYDNLNPGGWIEITEWIVLLQSPNHSIESTAFYRWNLLLRQGLRILGSSLFYATEYRSHLRRTGFERIIETKNGALTNPCYPGKRLQKVGSLMTTNWNYIIEPVTMPVFTTALGWTPEEVKALLVDVRKEIGDTRYHSFATLLTVYARKPKDGSSSASTSDQSSIQTTAPPRPSSST